jgi:hypothetical protein
MPIASQSEQVRIVACASNSPRMAIVVNPPMTIQGSKNLPNACGNSSKPEYQRTATICSLAGVKKCMMEKSAETKIAAGIVGKVCRIKPRIAPLNKASSIRATEMAVRSKGGKAYSGKGLLNSQTLSQRKPAPNAEMVQAEIRKPPRKWDIRWGFLRRPRFWSCSSPIDRRSGIRSRKAEINTERLKNR